MAQRNIVIALVVSLAINLFLVGTVVGGLVVGQRMKAGPPQGRGGGGLMLAGRELSPENRTAYREILRGDNGDLRVKLRQVRQARDEAWAELGREPLDVAAVHRRLADARTQEIAARGLLEDRIVTFAADLPADQRAKLAEGLTRPPRGEGPGKRGEDREKSN